MIDIERDALRLIVFDWDGTLMDSVDRIVGCMQAASIDSGVGVPSSNAVKNIIGLGLQEALQELFPDSNEQMRHQLVMHYRRHFLYESRIVSQLFEGVIELLVELRAVGYDLAVATGKARRGLDKVLIETKTAGYFSATRCADETQSKPHPQMLLDLMDGLGVGPHQTLMVGDTEFDLEMASAAGVAAIAVDYGAHATNRLLRHSPLACLSDIRQLSHWLLNRA